MAASRDVPRGWAELPLTLRRILETNLESRFVGRYLVRALEYTIRYLDGWTAEIDPLLRAIEQYCASGSYSDKELIGKEVESKRRLTIAALPGAERGGLRGAFEDGAISIASYAKQLRDLRILRLLSLSLHPNRLNSLVDVLLEARLAVLGITETRSLEQVIDIARRHTSVSAAAGASLIDGLWLLRSHSKPRCLIGAIESLDAKAFSDASLGCIKMALRCSSAIPKGVFELIESCEASLATQDRTVVRATALEESQRLREAWSVSETAHTSSDSAESSWVTSDPDLVRMAMDSIRDWSQLKEPDAYEMGVLHSIWFLERVAMNTFADGLESEMRHVS
jgi:hypothetical protein